VITVSAQSATGFGASDTWSVSDPGLRNPGGRYCLENTATDSMSELIGLVDNARSQHMTNGWSCGGSISTGEHSARR
jgi:hypothetical protein